jgi:hypothetical protein
MAPGVRSLRHAKCGVIWSCCTAVLRMTALCIERFSSHDTASCTAKSKYDQLDKIPEVLECCVWCTYDDRRGEDSRCRGGNVGCNFEEDR